MKAIKTHLLTPESLSSAEKDFIYNGLDCCVTFEVFEVLQEQLDNLSSATYSFERDLQGPILEMNMHGLLVDLGARDALIDTYSAQIARMERQLQRLVSEGLGTELLNWRSPDQFKKLLYDKMGLPPVKHQGKTTKIEKTINSKHYKYSICK